ncbi:hypothetical protein DMA88_20385 [Salmonella enterica subsp. enterica serovar Infantis]|nr:hypothetical protein [Salmonella enterica subsp. enterica serovar Infantis]
MNLKRNINGCRNRESYSVSFFLINQLLMINNPKFPKFSRISVFRAFSLLKALKPKPTSIRFPVCWRN